MDLIKIGKYIAGKRKELGMTQRQLAEKLGMSDKSVSKWERGVCLPDVSVYYDLCLILGISINEFLAGEDIAKENIIKKSEDNIIGVATDSKQKQKYLKMIIIALSAAFVVVIMVIASIIYRANKPQNFIIPVSQDSVEMETVRLFAGPDGAHIYKFTTTNEYKRIKLFMTEYQSGERIELGDCELGFDGMNSPKDGEILVLPDFKNFTVKVVISAEGSKISTDIPILENVPEREYYGRSASEISEKTNIRYNEQQPLLALIYDNDEMCVLDINDFLNGETECISNNDYMYFFSYEFCEE